MYVYIKYLFIYLLHFACISRRNEGVGSISAADPVPSIGPQSLLAAQDTTCRFQTRNPFLLLGLLGGFRDLPVPHRDMCP